MLSNDKIRVLVLHQDPLISAGAVTALRQQADFEVIAGEPGSTSIESNIGHQPSQKADVIVADYNAGLEIMADTRREAVARGARPATVLIVTRCEGEYQIRRALELGVRGYLLLGCSLQELAEAVRALHRGSRYIDVVVAQHIAESVALERPTERETEVLRLLAIGHCNKSIALKLDIAVGTVKSHVKAILQKLDVATRTEAAAVADRRGLLALQLESDDHPIKTKSNWKPLVARHALTVSGPSLGKSAGLIQAAKYVEAKSGKCSAQISSRSSNPGRLHLATPTARAPLRTHGSGNDLSQSWPLRLEQA